MAEGASRLQLWDLVMVVNPVLSAVAKVHRGADEHLSTAEAPDSYTGYPELLLFHYIALVKSGVRFDFICVIWVWSTSFIDVQGCFLSVWFEVLKKALRTRQHKHLAGVKHF